MQSGINYKNINEDQEFSLPQRKSLSDEVFEILLNRIVVGNYLPGNWLRQNDIAQELSVSHTPVREAFDRLVTEGLAERVPYRGVRVPKMDTGQILENYQARIVMEVSIVNLSAQFISESAIQQVELINHELGKLKKLKDMPRHRQLNRSFHLLIAENCQNQQLMRLHQLAWNQFPDWMLYERIFHQQAMLVSSLMREHQDHLEITAALKAHQPQKAMRMAFQHMVNVGEELVTLLNLPEDGVREKQQAAMSMINL